MVTAANGNAVQAVVVEDQGQVLVLSQNLPHRRAHALGDGIDLLLLDGAGSMLATTIFWGAGWPFS